MKNIFYESLKYDDPMLPIIFHLDKIKKDMPILAHWHENIEILYVINGEITVSTEFGSKRAETDEIVVINSGNLHKINAENEAAYYCLIIDKKMCEEFSLHIGETHFSEVINDKKTIKLFKKITAELFDKKIYYKTAVKSDVISLIVHLSRYHANPNIPMTEYSSNIRVDIVKSAVKFIQDNYNKNISIIDIARFLGLSDAYLCRLFKKITGCTIIHYINLLRCQKARMLIQSEKYTVSEAAAICGFENLSYFTKTYKKHMGHVPSHYRN